MASTVLLNTVTDVNVVLPDAIDIRTYYTADDIPNLLSVFISDYLGIYNGIKFNEGKCIATFKDNSGFNIYSNSDGTVTIEDNNAAKYSIDATTGQLQYTE